MIKYHTPYLSERITDYLYISHEDLFWMRIDVGIACLNYRYGKDDAMIIARIPAYWQWMLRIWENTDKSYLMREIKYKSKVEGYKKYQLQQLMKYRISSRDEYKYIIQPNKTQQICHE
jgi:hypothetical protein